MSPELQRFYNEIQAWIDADLPEHPVFNSQYALCAAAYFWGQHNGLYPSADVTLILAMRKQFFDAGLNETYPFNQGDHSNFMEEYEAGALWTNEARLAWVRKQTIATSKENSDV